MKQPVASLNSVEKALKIMLAFDEEHLTWGVRELGGHLGFSPATVQRILQTLKAHDFVEQDSATRQYRLGSVYFRLFHTLQSSHTITRLARPYMQRLLTSTQETVHLNIIKDNWRVCIENLEPTQYLKASMPVGQQSPLHAGASSKCLLAFSDPDLIESYLSRSDLAPLTDSTITNVHRLRDELHAIRRQGYAVSLGERSPGLGSLSAPLRDHRGIVLASLTLSIPDIRFRDEAHRAFCLKELIGTALDFSASLGFTGGSGR